MQVSEVKMETLKNILSAVADTAMFGAIVNTVAVLIGGCIGLLLK